jgi:tetratricopeptide (TPR) repeat protein
MALQGDIAGIALAELLQSLARSEPEGVLELTAPRLTARLGIREGLLYLLPAREETSDLWRQRVRRAWPEGLPATVELQRVGTVARAARLESLYELLETRTVHFTFSPDPLATVTDFALAGLPRSDLGPTGHGAGLAPGALLLEHARLSDLGANAGHEIERHFVPVAPSGDAAPDELRAFVSQCSGGCTIGELADRLGMTLRNAQIQALAASSAGCVEFLPPPRLLEIALEELAAGHVGRAAARFLGWLSAVPPGWIAPGEAALLESEWRNGRLANVLREIEPRAARGLLRRLDHAGADPATACARWSQLRDQRRSDAIAALHAAALRIALPVDPKADPEAFAAERAGSVAKLVRLACGMRDQGLSGRAIRLLRLAASSQPEKLATRLELGQRLLELGAAQEGAALVIEGAKALMERGEHEAALPHLRALLKQLPEERDAQGLLISARAQLVRRRRRKANTLIGAGALLALALTGVVSWQSNVRTARELEEIAAMAADPEAALSRLATRFGDSDAENVVALRTQLAHALRDSQVARRQAWLDVFEEARLECRTGDPRLALERMRDLPAHPELGASLGSWPEPLELVEELILRLETEAAAFGADPDLSAEALRAEGRFIALLADVERACTDDPGAELSSFRYRLTALIDSVEARRTRRAEERQRLLAATLQAEQDMLLASARTKAEAGELELALACYERLLAGPDGRELAAALQREVDAVRAHAESLAAALELAERGRHAEALERLVAGCSDPSEHMLPWRVETTPSGVRARLADGTTRVAPFTLQSAPGELVALSFEHAGYETLRVDVESPADLAVVLARAPEWSWGGDSRVEAVPVPVGEDHVLADRHGRLARVSRAGAVRWKVDLATLAGVARTPIFLPSRPGKLLVIAEDGKCWTVDVGNGAVDGPWESGAPPTQGMVVTRSGIGARFTNGNVAIWSSDLVPEVFEAERLTTIGAEYVASDSKASGNPGSLSVLRLSAASARELASPWTGAVARVERELIEVSDSRAAGAWGFRVRTAGAVAFVAWEAPNVMIPHGKLWVSDDLGLRCLLPLDAK